MSTTTLALDDGIYKRLHVLSDLVGQSPGVVLDQALADYEQKLLSGDLLSMVPRTSTEAELLDDPGRISMPPHGQQVVQADIVSIGRRPRPASSEPD